MQQEILQLTVKEKGLRKKRNMYMSGNIYKNIFPH